MDSEQYRTATFANGCFWCTEAVFQRLKGVVKVQSGFSGGHTKNPSYREVCTGETGHAECLQITYDPNLISYEQLLEVFWATHDPTTLNRQGNDIGTQYRSVIFYHDEEQRQKAEASKKMLEENKVYDKPIVTFIQPFEVFYPAEPEHDNYYNLHSSQPYCYYVTRPKVQKLKKFFGEWVRKG
ncbi:MAG: peptide-methionine (S)-S-oxide reductase MsrA [Chitinophagaceae bacterium]|nr:peptide-methionine (S)-S-oxide reductase MsrA [Chitinophagaceae bacterium]